MKSELPETNLCFLEKSRKRLHNNGLFRMKVKGVGYIFARVILTDCAWSPGENARGAILVHVYDYVNQSGELPSARPLGKLLIPPKLINRLGWSRGYFQTIPRPDDDDYVPAPHHHFHYGGGGYYDECARPVEIPVEPIGRFASGNYRTLDDEVSEALGIPLA